MNEPPKRPHCAHCQRPLVRCLCELVVAVENHVDVLILQHPLEVNNAKNTVGLLTRSLKNNRIYRGEQFIEHELHTWLYADNKIPLLLYPDTPEEQSLGLCRAMPLPDLHHHKPEQLRLVVIDGTWRKSRKILYKNSLLQALPRLALTDMPQSMYRIRKAHSENQLSTLEASCYALQQLEPIDCTPLFRAFAAFIAQQQRFIPS